MKTSRIVYLVMAAFLALPSVSHAETLVDRLSGRILLQVEGHGEAWYVNPADGARYYMKDGPTAYEMMRNFGLGITDDDLGTIPSVMDADAMKSAAYACGSTSVGSRLKGKILLQVQAHGEAWYVDPDKCQRVYLADGFAAYRVMRLLSLGITDVDLGKVESKDMPEEVQKRLVAIDEPEALVEQAPQPTLVTVPQIDTDALARQIALDQQEAEQRQQEEAQAKEAAKPIPVMMQVAVSATGAIGDTTNGYGFHAKDNRELAGLETLGIPAAGRRFKIQPTTILDRGGDGQYYPLMLTVDLNVDWPSKPDGSAPAVLPQFKCKMSGQDFWTGNVGPYDHQLNLDITQVARDFLDEAAAAEDQYSKSYDLTVSCQADGGETYADTAGFILTTDYHNW